MLYHIESENDFNEKINNNEKTILVDFYTTWCGPCQMLAPVIEELAKECESVDFLKIDVDQVTSVAVDFGIEVVPTLVVIKEGKEAKRTEGFMSKAELKEFLEV